ncbi:hypothetical protein HY632_01165 [Candidatus Uhrbacteria bacterium]|nr:hypothetical protein [Candidatus Uhrbacteria bacterium]
MSDGDREDLSQAELQDLLRDTREERDRLAKELGEAQTHLREMRELVRRVADDMHHANEKAQETLKQWSRKPEPHPPSDRDDAELDAWMMSMEDRDQDPFPRWTKIPLAGVPKESLGDAHRRLAALYQELGLPEESARALRMAERLPPADVPRRSEQGTHEEIPLFDGRVIASRALLEMAHRDLQSGKPLGSSAASDIATHLLLEHAACPKEMVCDLVEYCVLHGHGMDVIEVVSAQWLAHRDDAADPNPIIGAHARQWLDLLAQCQEQMKNYSLALEMYQELQGLQEAAAPGVAHRTVAAYALAAKIAELERRIRRK